MSIKISTKQGTIGFGWVASDGHESGENTYPNVEAAIEAGERAAKQREKRKAA